MAAQLADTFGPILGCVGQDKSSAVVAGQFSIYAHKYLSTECLSASADLLCTQTRAGHRQLYEQRTSERDESGKRRGRGNRGRLAFDVGGSVDN